MSTATHSQLIEFRDFLNAKIAAGPADMSPEEALDEFRDQMTPQELEESVAAIRESLAEIQSGSQGKVLSVYLSELEDRLQKMK